MDDLGGTLAGRYQLAEEIGRGGMGTVYRAVDLVLDRSVAVKLLPGLLAARDPTSVARFEREARAAAALSHPSVVAIYDTGGDDRTRFIVMELIAGRSLEAILRDEGRLEPERAAAIAAHVADALASAHAAGIVHRDVKPANVMVAQDGSVKVLDFGIARATDATTLTQTASVLGTAAYMAPEQALGKPADERSDIYSLGCVLYAMLARHPPFSGDSAAAILHQHANIRPSPPRARNGRVSPELEELVLQMLAKSPCDRPQTAAQVRDRLRSLATRSSPGHVLTSPTARLPSSSAALAQPRGPRHERRRLILAGALVVLAVVIAVVVLASGGSSPRTSTSVRRGIGASKPKAPTTPSHAAASTATPTASTNQNTTARTTAPSGPRTVSGAAGSLTALATQDLQAGAIDQQAAQQIMNALTDILNSYEAGHTMDAEHKLADLSQHVSMFEEQGHISPAATSALNRAVANLSPALTSAPPPVARTPGHREQAPGEANH